MKCARERAGTAHGPMATVEPAAPVCRVIAVDKGCYLSGQLLLAMPGIGDPRFDRAIIAICAHDEGGALGVGIGTEISDLGFHDLLDQFGIDHGDVPNHAVHFGGPVEPGRGFVLHSNDWSGQDTVDVAGRWALSGTIDVLRAIAAGKGPARWLAALGYAGWDGGQLDSELTRHGWFNIPGDAALLFDVPTEDRWVTAFSRAGIDPKLLACAAGNA